MAVKGRVGLPIIDVLAADTTVLQPASPNTRVAVSAFSLYNDTAGNVTVDIYESPDLTSASGEKVAQYVVAANSSEDVIECIGQGYAINQNLIAVGDLVGVNAKVTVTEYTGSS